MFQAKATGRGKRMKKIFVLLLPVMVLLPLISSCNTKTNYATDEPFIIITIQPAGEDDYRNLFSRNIALYDDGRLLLYKTKEDSEDIDTEAPFWETQLTETDTKAVKTAIEDHHFWRMPEDVSSPSEDGTFYYTTVHLTDETKTVGGLNPDHESFFAIQDMVKSKIPDNEYEDWQEKTTDYMFETHP